MYQLKDEQKRIVKMKSGQPFTYTTEATARLGAKHLGRRRKQRMTPVPVTLEYAPMRG